MSLDLHPFRMCRFCRTGDFVRVDGSYQLVHYSVRSYAHWACLVKAKGEAYAKENAPPYQQKNLHPNPRHQYPETKS